MLQCLYLRNIQPAAARAALLSITTSIDDASVLIYDEYSQQPQEQRLLSITTSIDDASVLIYDEYSQQPQEQRLLSTTARIDDALMLIYEEYSCPQEQRYKVQTVQALVECLPGCGFIKRKSIATQYYYRRK